MGPFGALWGANPIAPTFSENISSEQKKNRLLLFIAATKAGLTNYKNEYWHFSLKNRCKLDKPTITTERITSGNLSKELDLCARSFTQHYKKINILTKVIKSTDFVSETRDFEAQKDGVYFVRAFTKDKLAGYASYEKTDVDGEIYIRQLAVEPECQRKGVGKKLSLDAIFQLLPNTKHILVITRKTNESAIRFYRSLAFIESSFMHKGYSRDKYVSLEYVVPENKKTIQR